LHRKALEMDRRARQGIWNRTALSRSRSAARGADRRPGICLSPWRSENARGGSEAENSRCGSDDQEGQAACCTGRSQRGQTREKRKIVQRRENREIVQREDDVNGQAQFPPMAGRLQTSLASTPVRS